MNDLSVHTAGLANFKSIQILSFVWIVVCQLSANFLPHKTQINFDMNKRCAPFTQNCNGAKYLRSQFALFDQNPTKGLDPSIVKPKEIKDVYHRHPEFHPYSLGSFPTNYKTHALLYLINKEKEWSESDSKRRKSGKFCCV